MRFMRFVGLMLILSGSATAEERPTAMRLFPARTVLFARAADATRLSQKADRSIGGQMFQDPEISPFVGNLWGRINDRFAEGPGERMGGTSLNEMLSNFRGEFAIGMVSRRNTSPTILLLLDAVSADDREANNTEAITAGREQLNDLLTRIREASIGNGYRVAEEAIGAATASVFRRGDNADNSVAWIERDGTLVISGDKAVLESVIAKWDGLDVPDDEEGRPSAYAESLSGNRAFSESLRQCVEHRMGGGDAGPPDLVGFVDPIGIVKSIAQTNGGVRVALAVFPALGIDGIEGASLAMWYDIGDWDALVRGHLLLDNPRSGVLKIARLAACDPTPCPAVPADMASYYAGAIDPVAVLENSGALHDKIRGEGTFAKMVQENVTRYLGVEPRVLLEELSGKATWLTGFGPSAEDEPPRATAASVFLFETKNQESAQKRLAEVIDRHPDLFGWAEHRGVKYAWLSAGAEADDAGKPAKWQQDRPAFAVFSESLVFSQTPSLMHHLIETHTGEHPRLAEHLPFRLVSGRTKRLSRGGTGEGMMLAYEDPTNQFRRWLLAAQDDENRAQLDELAERAPPLRLLRDAIDEAGLPSIDALLKYASPSGSAVYDTPTGFRYVAFAYKREAE